jgi:hypothetical protein
MTIKQQGGIFGRNPTFNNVTVDGTLTVDQIVEKTGAAGITLDGVTLKDGNVVLADGKGIDFSATPGTGTSELFDDYEEGTWTPVLNFGGSDGAASYVARSGYYTKVGDKVTVWCYIMVATASAATGTMTISGLPFVATSVSNFEALGSVGLDNAASNIDQPISRVFSGQPSIIVMSGTNANNWSTLTDSGVKNNALRVYTSVTYKA